MTIEEAIKHLKEWKEVISIGRRKEVIDMAIEAIKTVQKHEETFEWCNDCKEYDKENHCCHRWSKVIKQTRLDMEEEMEVVPWEEEIGIVQCKDCKWHLNGHLCKQLSHHYGSIETPPSFYCGLGERRTDD